MTNKEGSKYGHLAKEIKILENVGTFDKCAIMDGEFFGWDSISIRYGLVGKTGMITEETDKLHTHDYDQLLWILSSDPDDMLELGGTEVEVTMGEKGERHKICIPSSIVIPKGTPHFSPVVTKLDRKIFFVSINCTGKLAANVVDENKKPDEGFWGEFRSEFTRFVRELHFARKGPYHYGSGMLSDSGGTYAHLNNGITGIPITMTWQTVRNPHWLGPRRNDMTYGPHVHTFDETLIFLSLDQDDLTNIHAKAAFSFGEEGDDQETFLVTKATAMTMPGGVYHLPLEFQEVEKPMIFISLSANSVFSAKQQRS